MPILEQEGQKSLLQVMLDSKSLIKYVLSLLSKSLVLQIFFKLLSGKLSHSLGKEVFGNISVDVSLAIGISMLSLFLS